MNYRHAYHAGNFADVFKHIIVVTLATSLKKKDKPFSYLETHAGAGCYDLQSLASQKTLEFQNGIQKIMEASFSNSNMPLGIKKYLELVQEKGFPNRYPGSPLLAQALLKPMDSMVLMELHAEEYQYLKQLFREVFRESGSHHPKVSIHQQDGYLGLKAFLPPLERRGLILIDPPYEKIQEWSNLIQGLENALNRFKTGIYAIWYPIKDKRLVSAFRKDLKHLVDNLSLEVLFSELSIYPKDSPLGLTGCGMAIVNPPFEFKTELQIIGSWVWQALNIKGGEFTLK